MRGLLSDEVKGKHTRGLLVYIPNWPVPLTLRFRDWFYTVGFPGCLIW